MLYTSEMLNESATSTKNLKMQKEVDTKFFSAFSMDNKEKEREKQETTAHTVQHGRSDP